MAPGAVLLKERALDSYHNVLFSLTLFRARAGAWPARVTLVGHAFKRAARNPWRVWQGVFPETAADRGGLATRGSGAGETLDEVAPRLWSVCGSA